MFSSAMLLELFSEDVLLDGAGSLLLCFDFNLAFSQLVQYFSIRFAYFCSFSYRHRHNTTFNKKPAMAFIQPMEKKLLSWEIKKAVH